MIESLKSTAHTMPSNYRVKSYEYTVDEPVGYSVTALHWSRAEMYERVIAEDMGMEYKDFAAKVCEVMEASEADVKALWINYDQATVAQRKAYNIAFGITDDDNELEDYALGTDDTYDLEQVSIDELTEYENQENTPLDFN